MSTHRRRLGSSLSSRLIAVLPLFVAGFLPQHAFAADDETSTDPKPNSPPKDNFSGEEIIVTSDRGVPMVGGAAHEIDRETLERQGNDDIHKVLAGVPGVYVRTEDGFGLRPNIGMRGASSDRSAKITLLEDGIPLAPAPYAAPAAYYFPLTTRMYGVEVFKGPAAIAYGPQTIGGAINLLTRPVPDGWNGAVDAAYGSFGTAKLHGWGGVGGSWGGVLLEAAHLSSDGFKTLDSGGPTGFERQDLMLKGKLLFETDKSKHELELKLSYGRERSNETYLGLTAADFVATPYRRYDASQLDVMQWQRGQAVVSWNWRSDSALSVQTSAYGHLLDRQWTKLNRFAGGADLHALLLNPEAGQAATYVAILRGEENSATADQVLQIGTNDRMLQNGGVQSVAKYWIGGKSWSNVPELGLRLHSDYVERLHTENPFNMVDGQLVATDGTTLTTLDSVSEVTALAGFVRNTFRAGPLVAVPGVRIEHIGTQETLGALATTKESGVEVSESEDAGTSAVEPPQTRTIALPGLAVSVATTPWLMVFAGAHRGFSPVAPGSEPDVMPETAWNGELGLRAHPGASFVEATGFGSWYENIQGQCALSAGCTDAALEAQYNGGAAWVAGLEALARHELPLPHGAKLSGSASYTYTYTAFQTGFLSAFPQWGAVEAGDALPYVPEHQGGFELAFQGFRAGASVSGAYRGDMRDVAGQGEIAEIERIPASATFDLAGNVRVAKGVTLYGLVRNVGDAATIESLRPFGARPGSPRTFILGIKVFASDPDNASD